MGCLTHRDAELRSLALHREVACRLRENPELLDRARTRVEGWRRTGLVSDYWTAAWSELLARPLEAIVAALTDPGERARDLRHCYPFAGVLEPRERWRILREEQMRKVTP